MNISDLLGLGKIPLKFKYMTDNKKITLSTILQPFEKSAIMHWEFLLLFYGKLSNDSVPKAS